MKVTVTSAFMMRKACDLTRDLVAKNPIRPDMIRDYEAVQGWHFVAALFGGIEQAFKMLLLAPPDTRFTLETLKSRKYGHNLEKLYSALEVDDRDHLELHFQEHWSLHQYDTRGLNIASAEDFVAHINRGGQDGGPISWRYILLQGTAGIPPTSLWTMGEIWDAVCCCINRHVHDSPRRCTRLSCRLTSKFDRLVPGRRVPNGANHDDLNHWHRHRNGNALAAWIDLLVKAHRGAMHEVQAPGWLRTELAKIAEEALAQMASDSADPDDAQLRHRIQTGPNLAWSPSEGTFH